MADVRDTWSAGRDGLNEHSQLLIYCLEFCFLFFPSSTNPTNLRQYTINLHEDD